MDEVDVGPLELLESLARVARQALHVLAVALGVDRVERQRGLARATRSRDHDQAATREPQLEVPEVMLPGSFDVNVRCAVHEMKRERVRKRRLISECDSASFLRLVRNPLKVVRTSRAS